MLAGSDILGSWHFCSCWHIYAYMPLTTFCSLLSNFRNCHLDHSGLIAAMVSFGKSISLFSLPSCLWNNILVMIHMVFSVVFLDYLNLIAIFHTISETWFFAWWLFARQGWESQRFPLFSFGRSIRSFWWI